MGLYEKRHYIKTRDGKWKCTECSIEKAPHDVGRWNQSCKLEEKSLLGEKTYLKKQKTKSGISQKIAKASTYFPDNTKVVRTLITTSNKLPQRYADKYNKK
nr:MAG TPA: hypothetical protein [Inoviridae sp.]